METERIALSQGERDRLRVLHEIKQKQITQREAASRLKISDRHTGRLLVGLGKRGNRVLIHGLRGRPSNRKLAARWERKILTRMRERYADFGPTLAAEHLPQEGLLVSRETLRKWMVKASLWCPRSCPFRSLEESGPACQLTEHDTTEENLRTLGEWLRRHGRPFVHYTDKNSVFRSSAPALPGEQLRGEKARSHFGRELGELGIEWIAAHRPQAKGRIERLFATLQDRLVKEMRQAGIDNIAAANYFLEIRFLPAWEERFTVARRRPRNAHRRLDPGQRLEEILSLRVGRQVADDHTVSWDGNRWAFHAKAVSRVVIGRLG